MLNMYFPEIMDVITLVYHCNSRQYSRVYICMKQLQKRPSKLLHVCMVCQRYTTLWHKWNKMS